ncbi:hypothetical protein ABIA33_000464 [Streptacidiphilus sp. MAP12-16]
MPNEPVTRLRVLRHRFAVTYEVCGTGTAPNFVDSSWTDAF